MRTITGHKVVAVDREYMVNRHPVLSFPLNSAGSTWAVPVMSFVDDLVDGAMKRLRDRGALDKFNVDQLAQLRQQLAQRYGQVQK